MLNRLIPIGLLIAVFSCQSGESLSLRLVGEWTSGKADAEKVLQSVAREFLPLFPEAELPVIEVEQKGGPISLFKRGPNGEIRVKLDTGGTLWAQHAFQFAHELGHILCRYEDEKHPNKWLEESICEMASLYALRRMEISWKTAAPYPNWTSYAPALRKYADERSTKGALPEGVTLAAWYAERAEAFNKNATNRENNLVIATALLPYFEEKPERWRAIWYVNVEKLTPAYGAREYLEAWRKNCPEELREVVTEVAKRLGVGIQ